MVAGGKTVYIVGFANSRDGVPWCEPGAEYWTINELVISWLNPTVNVERQKKGLPPAEWTRHFEVHPDDKIGPKKPSEADRGTSALYWEWLGKEPKGGRPIYMQRQREDVPASVAFPIWRLNEQFERRCPGMFRRYF